MTDLLFPNGVYIIFVGAYILFFAGVMVGSATTILRWKFTAKALTLLSGLVIAYMYYVVVIDLVFR